MSIRSIGAAIGDAAAELAAWEPEDANDLFDYFAMLPDALHDIGYAITRNADRIAQTALHEGVTDMLHATAHAVARAEDYAAELERIARLLGRIRPATWTSDGPEQYGAAAWRGARFHGNKARGSAMKNTASDLLGWALWYAARGWPVFPCLPAAKEPATGHGVPDATADPGVITAWWSSVPYNIGIPTGAPGPDVLDVDTHPGEDGWASWNRCKRAGLLAGCFRLVSTRSGGLHAYFAGTDRGCGRLRAEGLDYQARGGYVIAPPSYVLADEKGPAGAYVLIEDRPPTGAALPWDAVKRLLRPPPERPLRSTRRGAWKHASLLPR